MSRSYKKTPVVKQTLKGSKKAANKRIRKMLKNGTDIGNGNEYQKHTNSYDIADFACRWSKEDATQFYYKHTQAEYYAHSKLSKEWTEKVANDFVKRYPTLEYFLQEVWEKSMKRK